MAKQTRKEDFRVEVIPSINPFCRDPVRLERELLGECQNIADGIRRHVDDVGSVTVLFDTNAYCEHCGSRWTETSDQYNGGCCGKDEAANPDTAAA